MAKCKCFNICASSNDAVVVPISLNKSEKSEKSEKMSSSTFISDKIFYSKLFGRRIESEKDTQYDYTMSMQKTNRNPRPLPTKYPLFFEKNVIIEPVEHNLMKYSWRIVMDDELNYFTDLKKCGMISPSKTAVSWFYDIFYENVYVYDASNNSNMVDIFKNNMKIQAHALILIIKNFITIAEYYSSGKAFNYNNMYNAHSKLAINYSHYIIVAEILLTTFERCLFDQWTTDMEIAWCKTIAVLLKSVKPPSYLA